MWSHHDYPLIPVGKMVLDRNPVNYFAEVEQAAFCPSNFVPGIEASPDKMLQVRATSSISVVSTPGWTCSVSVMDVGACCLYVSVNASDAGMLLNTVGYVYLFVSGVHEYSFVV